MLFAGGQERSPLEAVWGTAIIFIVPFLLYFVLYTFIVVRLGSCPALCARLSVWKGPGARQYLDPWLRAKLLALHPQVQHDRT